MTDPSLPQDDPSLSNPSASRLHPNASLHVRSDSSTPESAISKLKHLHSFSSVSSIGIEAFTAPSALNDQVNRNVRVPPEVEDESAPLLGNMQTTTPLPKKIMTVLCIVIFCEPVSMTILCLYLFLYVFSISNYKTVVPFVYFMVRDFGLASDKEVGFYVGFIASSFSLAQFLTSLLWGWMSDKLGRRPVLLIGLLGNAVSLLLFGQSHTLTWAIFSRMLCGILNGNIGVAKCVIGEITDATNQSLGFSLIGIMWSLGTIFGPMVGGLLSNPAERWPDWLGKCPFLRENPYFLPCFVSAVVSLIGFVVGYFFLEETNGVKQEVLIDDNPACELVTESSMQATNVGLSHSRKQILAGSDSLSTVVVNESSTSLHLPFSSSSTELEIEDDCHPQQHPVEHDERTMNLSGWALGRNSLQAIIAYAFLSFQNMILEETFSLWIVTPESDGGMGYLPPDVGVCLSITGFVALYIQLVVYPSISRKHSTVKLFRTGSILYLLPFLLYPTLSGFISPYMKPNILVPWFILLGNLALRQLCNVLCFTSIFIIINNSANAGNLGLVNGIAQTSAAFVRSIGPALGGILWAWSISNGGVFPFNYWFVFLVMCAWGLMTIWQGSRLVDSGAGEASAGDSAWNH